MGGVISILDMNTTVLSYGAPELQVMSAAFTDIAKWLKIPMFSTAGCSDSKVLDEQAAIEAALSIATAALSGANLIHDVGYLESAMLGSYDMMVMSDEIISMVKHIMRGIPTTPDMLAANVIERVGPSGNYLGEEHTLEHFRTQFWFPKLMDRSRYENWKAKGSMTLAQRVRSRVLGILETTQPAPLPDAVERDLEAIIKEADSRQR